MIILLSSIHSEYDPRIFFKYLNSYADSYNGKVFVVSKKSPLFNIVTLKIIVLSRSYLNLIAFLVELLMHFIRQQLYFVLALSHEKRFYIFMILNSFLLVL